MEKVDDQRLVDIIDQLENKKLKTTRTELLSCFLELVQLRAEKRKHAVDTVAQS